MISLFVQIVFVPLILFLSTTNKPSKTRITGIYSDMHYNNEAGDLLGTEVFIVYSTDGLRSKYYALLQTAEGVPSPPVLVGIETKEDSVFFDWPGYSSFRGKVTDKALVGIFQKTPGEISLPRKKSYWQ